MYQMGIKNVLKIIPAPMARKTVFVSPSEKPYVSVNKNSKAERKTKSRTFNKTV